MKRFLPFLFLLLTACGHRELLPTDLSSFEIRIDNVAGTKVWFTITPDNPNAYYAFGEVGEGDEEYDMSPTQVAENQLWWMDEIYKEFAPYVTNLGSYADIFLYQGTRQHKEMYLTQDHNYKLFVMLVDPDSHQLIGNPVSVPFHTKAIVGSDLTFDVKFYTDAVEIIPSDNSQAYYWDYENTDVIAYEYSSPEYYYYQLTDMYEEYDFMNNLVDHGPSQWVFSVEDKSMNEGETCTLVVAGYAGGEITTELLIIDFIYHKNEPCEVLRQRKSKV